MKTGMPSREAKIHELRTQLFVNKIFLTLGITFLIILAGGVWLALANRLEREQKEDLSTSQERHGNAVVIRQLPGNTDKTGVYRNLIAMLEGHEVTLETRSAAKVAFTKLGDTVAVTYRIGKSGKYYLDNWEPPAQKVPLPVNR